MVAALDQVFRVGKGVVGGGVVGDGSQRGALAQRQLRHRLAKVGVGAHLHAVNLAGQRDGVQVGFQDGLFAVAVAQADGAEDLAHLAHVAGDAAVLVVVGQVFDQLLLDGGGAGGAAVDAVAGKLVEGRADGTGDVDAGLVVKVLVLNGDDRVLQILRDLLQAYPDAVVAAGKAGILDPLAGIAVHGIDNGGLFQLLVVQIQLAVIGSGLHDIHGQHHAAHAARHNAHTEQAGQGTPDIAPHGKVPAGLFLLFFAAAGRGGILRIGRFGAVRLDMPGLFGVYGDRLLCKDYGKGQGAPCAPGRPGLCCGLPRRRVAARRGYRLILQLAL